MSAEESSNSRYEPGYPVIVLCKSLGQFLGFCRLYGLRYNIDNLWAKGLDAYPVFFKNRKDNAKRCPAVPKNNIVVVDWEGRVPAGLLERLEIRKAKPPSELEPWGG